MECFDAVIIGAGLSGTLVAEHLSSLGKRILLIDGGPSAWDPESAQSADDGAWGYQIIEARCDWLRIRAVGGCSLAWGGWCERFPQQVFEDGQWPYGARTLAPYYARVERHIGVTRLPAGIHHRNVVRQLGLRARGKRLARVNGRVWSALENRVVDRVRTCTIGDQLEHSGGRATQLHTVGSDGQRGAVRARAFVLAASPIETARILLTSGLAATSPRIGHGLVYHPIVGYALVEPHGSKHPTRGPIQSSAMLVPRFVNLAGRRPRPYRGGFSIELDGPQSLASLAPGVRERIDPQRKLGPQARATLLHGIAETMPHPDRYMDIAAEVRDRAGRPVPRIHLAWSDGERRLVDDMRTTCITIAEGLAGPHAALVQYLDPFDAPLLFHEAGTCAMGRSGSFPCDPWGGLRALSNVWVADASALPSSGDRHPTLTILAHASRAAEAVGRYLGAN